MFGNDECWQRLRTRLQEDVTTLARHLQGKLSDQGFVLTWLRLMTTKG